MKWTNELYTFTFSLPLPNDLFKVKMDMVIIKSYEWMSESVYEPANETCIVVK